MQIFNFLPHIPGPPLEVEILEKTVTIGRYIPLTLIPADGIHANNFLPAFREEFKEFFKDTVEIIAKVVEDLFDEELEQTGDAPNVRSLHPVCSPFAHHMLTALADQVRDFDWRVFPLPMARRGTGGPLERVAGTKPSFGTCKHSMPVSPKQSFQFWRSRCLTGVAGMLLRLGLHTCTGH
jgi:hypothetical protein